MKTLFVSNDPSILTDGSARARMRAYRDALGELYIVTPAAKTEVVHDGALHIYGVATTRLWRAHALEKQVRTIVREQGIHVVSAQDPFEQGMVALRAIAGTTAKLHIQVHTDFLSPWFVRAGNFRSPVVPVPALNRVRRTLADQVLPRAHGIRVVSERIKRSLMERYGARIPEPAVLPIEVPMAPLEAVALPKHPFTFALITVGRLEPEKRIEDIIAALISIKDQYPAVGLFVVGDGRERARLERMVRDAGLTERVIFLGERADAPALMASAQAYIQASAYEGYGRTLVEAARAGVPIITTDVGIVGEVFRGYEEVLAAPVADPAALALHIRGLVEDMRARTELSMHAKTAVEAHLAQARSRPEDIAQDIAKLI